MIGNLDPSLKALAAARFAAGRLLSGEGEPPAGEGDPIWGAVRLMIYHDVPTKHDEFSIVVLNCHRLLGQFCSGETGGAPFLCSRANGCADCLGLFKYGGEPLNDSYRVYSWILRY